MTTFIALLRAVNVGGTGTLPMADLKRLCEEAGLEDVRTYIASGNAIFRSAKSEAAVKAALESALHRHTGKSVAVAVRCATELAQTLADNPFPKAEKKFTVAIFLDEKPAKSILDTLKGRRDEEVVLGMREIYVHYPSGQGRSKLRIKGAENGTARNMNTIEKLVAMTREPPAQSPIKAPSDAQPSG
jgi:uncharacterized protein (DUF1697 family)